MESKRQARRRWALLPDLVLSLASLGLCFLALEVGSRILSPSVEVTAFRNFPADRMQLLRSSYNAQHHPRLGWIPRPGSSGSDNFWGKQVTIGEDGIRLHPRSPRAASGGPVLAVGDSFTFGDEVADVETWPSQLEAATGLEVWNAGVFGYGLDQTVLRAEELAAKLSPAVVIVGFIADDVQRTELSVRSGAPKPYFRPVGAGLVLKNVPVPAPRPSSLGLARRVLGYSYFMDVLLGRIGKSAWWTAGAWPQTRVGDDGRLVCCRLMQRLHDRVLVRRARVVLLAQYLQSDVAHGADSPGVSLTREILACAEASGLEVLDTYSTLRGRYHEDPSALDALFRGHMTGAGNRLVADSIAAYLSEG